MSDLDLTLEPDEDGPRDEATMDIFGAPPPAPAAPYTVIARKYRPRTFEDLIGQEAMVRTLRNAFASGRIAHAFMLTGVRGVGKTTTARLLARALNYESDLVKTPSADLAAEGYHCASIIAGRNLNVIEVDAASQSKVDEMRDLLAGVATVPVGARYRVYVIDEVHMLSNAAFNALLKTLEEPPPHAKFIFATTEIRKVPVTILSRCQRFDLRRVEPDVIAANLAEICRREGALVDAEALALIARAAEGSVRDAQSLLDQAILQAESGGVVTGEKVRDMLGLADRSQTIGLLEAAMGGRASEAIAAFRRLYAFGAEPSVVVLDLLEHLHGASVARTLGPEALHLPQDQRGRLAAIGAAASPGILSRLWSLLLKAHEEVRRAPDPVAATEMALVRFCYAADLPGPEAALRRLQAGQTGLAAGAPRPALDGRPAEPAPEPPARAQAHAQGAGAAASRDPRPSLRPAAPPEVQPVLSSFNDVLALIELRRDIGLKMDVERFVRLVDFKPGQITYATAEGAPATLTQRLASRLREWTGRPWTMVIEGGGAGSETSYEREQREARAFRAEVERHPLILALMEAFPGAEITGVRRVFAPPASDEDLPGADGDPQDYDAEYIG
jgi:DNA polymerase-3 subunit gamma/tau